MLPSFLAKASNESRCEVCAYPAPNRLCGRCAAEEGPMDLTCVICKIQCGTAIASRIRLPCGDMVHATCAESLDRIGRCPGACAQRPNPDLTKCPSMQSWLLDFITDALNGGPPLRAEDLVDLEAEQMFWVLRCIYAHGIGVPRNDALEKKWRKEAIYHGDPEAQVHAATMTQDLTWMNRAAAVGHPKAILAMANFYRGFMVLGQRCELNKMDTVRFLASQYVDNGVDPVCRCLQGIEASEKGAGDAEVKLRRARRENFSTLELFNKVTVELARIYYDRNDLVEALALTASLDSPTPNVHVSAGITLSAISGYAGDAKHDALQCFLKADNADAYVCMAKLMQANEVPGGKIGMHRLMERAAESGHPDAGFYFLQDPDCSDEPKYVAMLRRARDKGFLVRCAVFFLKNGKPALAEECKRIRLAIA